MKTIRSSFLASAATALLAGAVLTACVPSGQTILKENPYSEAIEAAEDAAEGISYGEAKEMGALAADGDAIIAGYEVKFNGDNLVVRTTVENVSEVEDVYEIMLTTEDGRVAYGRGTIAAGSSGTIEAVIEGVVVGKVEASLNGSILGEGIDVETFTLN